MIMLSAFHMAKFADREPKIERAFYLSVLALGLFLYYSGRAHSFVLMLVVWPVVLIFFFLADQALITSKRRVHFFVYLATLFFVSAPLVVYYSTWFPVIEYIRNGYEPKHIATEEDIAFLKSVLNSNERVAILAENQTTYHIATNTWPALKGPSLAELLTYKEINHLNKEIAEHGSEKLIINSASKALAFSPDLLKLNGLYTLSKRGPGDRLLYYTRVHAPAKKRSSSQPGDLHELNR